VADKTEKFDQIEKFDQTEKFDRSGESDKPKGLDKLKSFGCPLRRMQKIPVDDTLPLLPPRLCIV
jgi:hypothetical protein